MMTHFWSSAVGTHDKNWNPVTFLVLFKASEDNIQSNWMSMHLGRQYHHLHHPISFTQDALHAATLPIYPGSEQALSYA